LAGSERFEWSGFGKKGGRRQKRTGESLQEAWTYYDVYVLFERKGGSHREWKRYEEHRERNTDNTI